MSTTGVSVLHPCFPHSSLLQIRVKSGTSRSAGCQNTILGCIFRNLNFSSRNIIKVKLSSPGGLPSGQYAARLQVDTWWEPTMDMSGSGDPWCLPTEDSVREIFHEPLPFCQTKALRAGGGK